MLVVILKKKRFIYLSIFRLRQTYSKGKHTPAHGLANASRMRTAISHGQWQPWTAVSPLLGLIGIYVTLRSLQLTELTSKLLFLHAVAWPNISCWYKLSRKQVKTNMVYGTRFNLGGVLALIFPSYVPLASQSPYPL